MPANLLEILLNRVTRTSVLLYPEHTKYILRHYKPCPAPSLSQNTQINYLFPRLRVGPDDADQTHFPHSTPTYNSSAMHPTPTLLLLFLLNLHLSTSFLPPPSLSLPSLHLHRASSSLPGRKPKRDPISNIDDVIDWFDSSSDLDDVKNSMNLMRKAYEGGKEEEFEEWKSAR